MQEIDYYVNEIVNLVYNIYQDCFYIYYTKEPFQVRINFECQFKNKYLDGGEPVIIRSYIKLTEFEIRDILTYLSIFQLKPILDLLDFKILQIIEAVEKNDLTGYQFDRETTRIFNERTKSIINKKL